MKKTMFFSDERKEDFAFIARKEKLVIDNYKYINNNIFYKIAEFFVYRIIMLPIAFLFPLFKHKVKYKNKRVLKKIKTGYFLYGNHTQIPSDAYFPNVISFPRKSFVIIHPDSIAIKGTENFIKMSGGMPIPSNLSGIKNFMNAIERRVRKHAIVIYPESHVWPYYTKIRNFGDTSFKYPIKFNKPSFCFTVVYKKRKFGNKPKVVVYVDGPFYSDKEKTQKQQQIGLRNQIYDKMVERAKESNCEYIRYFKRSESND